MMTLNRPTTTPAPTPTATALADKLLAQADVLERTRTSLAALWWDCQDTYERALIDAISLTFGLYSEDLCIEAATLLGMPEQAIPEHIDRSGVLVRVNSIHLLMDLLKNGYDELCQDLTSVGVLSNQQCEEFADMHAAFVNLFGAEDAGVILEPATNAQPARPFRLNSAAALVQTAKPIAA